MKAPTVRFSAQAAMGLALRDLVSLYPKLPNSTRIRPKSIGNGKLRQALHNQGAMPAMLIRPSGLILRG